MAINTYLFFEGRTEEALEFYKKALGAEVQMVMRYKDSPQGPKGPDGRAMPPEKVMHASALIGGTVVMASDGSCSGKPSFDGFSLSFEASDEADAKKRFDALSAGGKVSQPLIETFFAKSFGMCHDKFGVGWMVIAGMKEGDA